MILSIVISNDCIGAAYYSSNCLHILKSQVYVNSMIESCKLITDVVRMQIQPTHIIVSSKSTPPLLDALGAQNDLIQSSEIVQRPSADFRFATAKQEILNLQIDSIHSNDSKTAIDTILQIDQNQVSIGCAGAILQYLNKVELQINRSQLSSIKLFHLSDFMFLSQDTIWSLSIFQQVNHANMHSASMSEQSSLFGLLNKTKTKMGEKMLKSWFMCPLQSISKINARQDIISIFLEPTNISISKELQQSLRIANIPMLLKRLRVKSVVGDWKSLYQFVTNSLAIINISRQLPQIFQQFNDVELICALEDLTTQIAYKIDFDESSDESRVVIKERVDTELDEMKRVYHGLDSFLSKLADRIVLPPNAATAFTLVYFPQLGFLIAIQFPDNTNDFTIQGLVYQFSTENCGYYKNDAMKDLDDELGDVHSNIADRELEIMQGLRDWVLGFTATLLNLSTLISELDCLLALAESALEYRYVRPTFVDEKIIQLVGSRHPIIEQNQDFVANDMEIDHCPIIFTGPNASGKSVFMQQVALITFMAHIGSFVPCITATLGITSKILTRIRTPHSISDNESSFLTDLKQAALAVEQVNDTSLILLDEFGKGTVASDGIGLFCGIMSHLARKSILLIATHYYEIFDLPNFVIDARFYSFEMKEFEYMYQLIEGQCTRSLGILCAIKAGCPTTMIDRSSAISKAINNGEPIPALKPHTKRDQAAAVIVRDFLALDLDQDIESCLWRRLRSIQSLFD